MAKGFENYTSSKQVVIYGLEVGLFLRFNRQSHSVDNRRIRVHQELTTQNQCTAMTSAREFYFSKNAEKSIYSLGKKCVLAVRPRSTCCRKKFLKGLHHSYVARTNKKSENKTVTGIWNWA